MVAFEGGSLEGQGIIPLPIYPWEAVYADLSVVRDAYMSLHLPGSVRPVEAVPGSPGTVLAIGDTPPWVCSYAPVSSVHSPGLPYAIKCCLLGLRDERIVDAWTAAENILTEVFGEVTFIEEIPYVRSS